MTAEYISDALGLLADDILEEADNARNKKEQRKHPWFKWASMAACICLLVVAGAVALPRIIAGPTKPLDGDVSGSREDLPDGASPLGKIRPELLVNGTVFYWSNISQIVPGQPETYLPDEYTEYGSITSVTESELTQDGQMKAAFSASGTIYTSEATPEVVYVRMTTDWFENSYVRFINAGLNNGYNYYYRIAWKGRSYRFVPAVVEGMNEQLKELPDGCELIGGLHFIGQDAIPDGDLETNCSTDSYNFPLEGREVYYNADDPDYIYVYERQYWREGEYDAYLKCPLW